MNFEKTGHYTLSFKGWMASTKILFISKSCTQNILYYTRYEYLSIRPPPLSIIAQALSTPASAARSSTKITYLSLDSRLYSRKLSIYSDLCSKAKVELSLRSSSILLHHTDI